jgi:energy-coupling factor transport system permease protein
LLLLAVVAFVVSARRPATPWAGSFGVFLRLGLIVIGVRVLLFAIFAGTPGTHVLFTLPSIGLPGWLAGLRIGGAVTAEGLLAAAYDGLRLATVLCCVGAANSLTSPRRLLKSMPATLFEAGVAVTVALSVAPQAVASLGRLRTARRLRGRPEHGWRAVRGLLIPTLEGALDGSVELAAAMDARGFGRRGATPRWVRRIAGGATLGGLLAVTASTYGLLVGSAPRLLGWPLIIAGAVLLLAGLGLAARGGRTRHRPDPWRICETLVAGCGLAAAVLLTTGTLTQLNPSTTPPTWPSLPLLPLLGLLVALAPAWLAPPLPTPTPPPRDRRDGRHSRSEAAPAAIAPAAQGAATRRSPGRRSRGSEREGSVPRRRAT